ncbi:hypothetical protein BJV78DRAFT_1186621 [Lactifluus subvellereus]|nr:hypothetical protein BJV78DRAFT_1186621 [Lactifluus subvellereus]
MASYSTSTLTRPQFEHACKALIGSHGHSTSSPLNATILKGWSWAEHPTVTGLGYMSRTALLQCRTRKRDSDLVEEDGLESGDTIDDPAVARDASSGFLTCGQSIVFSPTFQVPVFYFTVHDSYGAPLALEEIMNTSLLRSHVLSGTQVTSFALVQLDALFPLLSQGDHPTLGTPSWFIHPCGTACAMGELIGEKNAGGMPEVVNDKLLDWLEMWFMVLGNIVEL